MTKDQQIQEVFNAWNAFKGHKNAKGTWKGHSELTGYRKRLIREAVARHGFKGVLGAIVNYHKVWHSRDYRWTYTWNLMQFLTRKDKSDLLQIVRFLPDCFAEAEYLTESARNRRKVAEQAKAQQNPHVGNMKAVPERKPLYELKKKFGIRR